MRAEVYSKSVCPHCVRAKMVLKNRGIEFDEIDAPSNMAQMESRVLLATGKPPLTVPQIWLDGQYIGGADELVSHFRKVDLANDLGGFEL